MYECMCAQACEYVCAAQSYYIHAHNSISHLISCTGVQLPVFESYNDGADS